MLISRFCEARGWYEADNSIESKIFCFGDEGGSSGSGSTTDDAYEPGNQQTGQGSRPPGGSDASGDPSEESTVDYSGDPGFDEGDTGDTGDTGGTGADSNFYPDASGAPVYPQAPDYSRPSPAPTPAPTPAPANIGDNQSRGVDIPNLQRDRRDREEDEVLGQLEREKLARELNVTSPLNLGEDDSLFGQIGPGGELFDYSGQDDIFGDLTEKQLERQEYVSGLTPGSPAAAITSQVTDLNASGDPSEQSTVDFSNNISPVDLDEVPAGAIDLTTAGATPPGSSTPPEDARGVDIFGDVDPVDLIGPVDLDETPAGALNPFAQMEQEVAQGLGTGTAALGPVTDKYAGEVVPGMGESIDRAISDFAGQRIGRTQEIDDEGNVTTEDFGLRGDLVSKPTPFLSGYDPAQQNIMEEGYLAERRIDLPFSPFAEGILNAVVNPIAMVTDAIRNKGAIPIYSKDGTQIIGAKSPDGSVVYSETPFSDILSGITGDLDPNMQESYSDMHSMQAEARSRDSNNEDEYTKRQQEELREPEPEPEPDYAGRNIIQTPNYQARGPVSYAYTGLPSLAPQKLKPTYVAKGQYSPLFPMGQRRR